MDTSRYASPRPDTPELGSMQGRRNTLTNSQLLDEDGVISPQFESCLRLIFAKYCTPPPSVPGAPLPQGAAMSSEGLDAWARDTNGHPFSAETKEELIEFLDVNEDGALTFEGFMQIYQLQTENDEEETWRDLSNHGFDRSLKLVSSRREDESDSKSPSKSGTPS